MASASSPSSSSGNRAPPWSTTTAYQTIPNAVRAIRHGAEDYSSRRPASLPILERVLELQRRARPTAPGGARHRRGGSSGTARPIERDAPGDRRAEQGWHGRPADTTLLLTGETGVGKEVACRFVHSRRVLRPRRLVVVDCLPCPRIWWKVCFSGMSAAPLPAPRSYSTGAFEEAARRHGVFSTRLATWSTVRQALARARKPYLPPPGLEPRAALARPAGLLPRNKDLPRLGGGRPLSPGSLSAAQRFPIHIPPLRERGDDILLLAEHFRVLSSERLHKPTRTLSSEISQALLGYSYPGDVRELKNIIERAVIMTESPRIQPRHLPERVLAPDWDTGEEAARPPLEILPGVDSLVDVEARMIRPGHEPHWQRAHRRGPAPRHQPLPAPAAHAQAQTEHG